MCRRYICDRFALKRAIWAGLDIGSDQTIKGNSVHLSGERILIFGGTGSLGRSLIRRLNADNHLMLFSRDEGKHWKIQNEVKSDSIQHMVGDIRDARRVEDALLIYRPTVVLIASALKQIDTCENFPMESIQTNILGIQNIIDAITRSLDKLLDLKVVNFISTDKACAPANVYGMCKSIGERMITGLCVTHSTPRFVGVRYGNVLESRGSIIPLFKWQSAHGEALTVTHPDMTRFVMTLDQSIDLIIHACLKAEAGEIFLPRLKAMRIIDLAEIFSERSGKPIKVVGIRPGEKLHEGLISDSESVRVRADGDIYRMAPALSEIPKNAQIFDYYSNQDVMTKTELAAYLEDLGVFDDSRADSFDHTI